MPVHLVLVVRADDEVHEGSESLPLSRVLDILVYQSLFAFVGQLEYLGIEVDVADAERLLSCESTLDDCAYCSFVVFPGNLFQYGIDTMKSQRYSAVDTSDDFVVAGGTDKDGAELQDVVLIQSTADIFDQCVDDLC